MENQHIESSRIDHRSLYDQLDLVKNDPLISQLMSMIGDGLVVLNDQGQILEVNEFFLEMLQIEDKKTIIGQRPGDAIKCVHAMGFPGGCGTSDYCSTCDAAMVILNSLDDQSRKESKCVASIIRDNNRHDLCLKIRSYSIQLKGQRLIFLFFQDITAEEWRVALEQVFFHDINNIITGLRGASYLVERKLDHEQRALVKPLNLLITRLHHEINLQNFLSNASSDYNLDLKPLTLDAIVDELSHFFTSHPVARGKGFKIPPLSALSFKSDSTLLNRVLINIVKNAFEATEVGGEVRMFFDKNDSGAVFRVWNNSHIPEDIARRIFQRHFSTKNEPGRGFGTYAIKLITERFLKGQVSFTSSPGSGTVFSLKIPCL